MAILSKIVTKASTFYVRYVKYFKLVYFMICLNHFTHILSFNYILIVMSPSNDNFFRRFRYGGSEADAKRNFRPFEEALYIFLSNSYTKNILR